jgi:hypothetical protein
VSMERPDGVRRGSLGRFVERLRGAMRIRRASGRNVVVLGEETPRGQAQPLDVVAAESTAPAAVEETTAIDSTSNSPAMDDSERPIASGAESMEIDDNAEPLLPLPTPRAGFSQEKAEALFRKYGIKVEPSIPTKVDKNARRVERPIRIRIHWTCHTCDTQFGASKVCSGCGHRRCDDCPRQPAKKVKEVLDNARRVQQEQSAGPSTQPQAGPSAAVVLENPQVPQASTSVDVSQPMALEPRSQEELDAEDELPSDPLLYVLEQRPMAGVEMVVSRGSQRTCHECKAHIDPAIRTNCESCGHQLCAACPRNNIRSQQWNLGEPKMVATVQRVYRKPRQRIRWNCHECHTMLVERRCRECGHERCKDCPRTP